MVRTTEGMHVRCFDPPLVRFACLDGCLDGDVTNYMVHCITQAIIASGASQPESYKARTLVSFHTAYMLAKDNSACTGSTAQHEL